MYEEHSKRRIRTRTEKNTIGLWKLLHMAFCARHHTCYRNLNKIASTKQQSITNKVIIIWYDGAHNRIISYVVFELSWKTSLHRSDPIRSHSMLYYCCCCCCCTVMLLVLRQTICHWMQCINTSKMNDSVEVWGVKKRSGNNMNPCLYECK